MASQAAHRPMYGGNEYALKCVNLPRDPYVEEREKEELEDIVSEVQRQMAPSGCR